MGSDERGVIERAGDGAIPGVFVGFSVAASRAYLESRTLAEKSAAATAAAMASKTPPTAEALRALRPKPLPAIVMTTAAYGALGGVFTGVEAIAENLRGKDDVWNRVIGAGTAGSLVGLRTGSIGVSIGASFACACMALSVGILGGTWGPSQAITTEKRESIYRA